MGAQKGTPARSVLPFVLVLSFVALGAAVLVLRLGFDRSTGVRHPRRRTRIRSRGRRSGGNYY